MEVHVFRVFVLDPVFTSEVPRARTHFPPFNDEENCFTTYKQFSSFLSLSGGEGVPDERWESW